MQQAFMVADRIVVLRHGTVAGDVATSKTNPDDVIQMITGENIANLSAYQRKEGQPRTV
jgi:D-xylose transport system ATP-binding protein